MKKCCKCNLEKPLNEFYKRGATKYRSECKLCFSVDWTTKIMSSVCSRTNLKKNDNTQRKSIFKNHNLTKEYLIELKEKQKGLCYWLNIPIDFTLKDKLRKVSLDRLDNQKGYEIGNVVLTTLFANLGRGNANITETKCFLNTYLLK